MLIQAVSDSPQNRRGDGQVSHLLLAPGQFGSQHLSITLVEGAPGSRQPLHAHPRSEQIYVIVSGRGRMSVAGEDQELEAGSLVFIPPGAEHAIFNPGPDQLVYVSATAPPFTMPVGDLAYEAASSGRLSSPQRGQAERPAARRTAATTGLSGGAQATSQKLPSGSQK